jgi:hypothetical protein
MLFGMEQHLLLTTLQQYVVAFLRFVLSEWLGPATAQGNGYTGMDAGNITQNHPTRNLPRGRRPWGQGKASSGHYS